MKGKMNFNLDIINFILLVIILVFLVLIMIRQSKEDFYMGPLGLGYSPLPCKADGSTDWDSKLQVGHETCVEYGSGGKELQKELESKKRDFSNKLLVVKSWKLVLGSLKSRFELQEAAKRAGKQVDNEKLSAINGDISDFIDEFDELLETDSVKKDDQTKGVKPINDTKYDLKDKQLDYKFKNVFDGGKKKEPDGLK